MAQYPDISRFPSGLNKDRFRFLFQKEFDKLNPSNTNVNQTDYDNILKRSWSTYSVNLTDPSDNNNTNNSGGGTEDVGAGRKYTGAIMGFFGKALETQEQKNYLPDYKDEMIEVKDIMGTILDAQGNLNKLSVIGKNVLDNLGGQLELYYDQQTALITRVNIEAGLTGDLAKNFREELTNANPRLLQLGIGFDELAQSVKTAFDESGRFNLLNQETLERAGEIGLAYVGSLNELVGMYGDFEKVGLGAADAQESIARAGQSALELGLRSKNVTKDLSTNIGKLNEYGFKNGIDGLSSMVRKATEFRMSIGEAFKIAEKVMDPDGAIELSANLQVLGGAIGDFNDPLKLMYMATNNVEGLQDALIGAAKGLATYNSEQGRFEITGVNLRRAREMAKQLGVDYGELAKGAIAAAEKTSASADLMARGLKLDKQQEEFITNLAQMKDGKMVIEVGSSASLKEYFKGQSTVKLEELTQTQVDELMKYQNEFKQMSPEQIVKQQATSIENMKRDVNYIAALLRNQAGQAGDKVMMELLAKGTGKSLKELEKEFSDWSRGQTGDIKELKEKFIQQATNLIGTTESSIKKVFGSKENSTTPSKGGTSQNQSNTTKTSENGPAAAANDLNKQKGPVYDGGTYVNPNSGDNQKPVEPKVPPTPPTPQVPNKKEEEKKEPEKPITVNLDLSKQLINAKIINENPINTILSGESIKALEGQKNLTTTETNKTDNNFLSEFERKFGSINKENESKPLTINQTVPFLFKYSEDKPIDVNIANQSLFNELGKDRNLVFDQTKKTISDFSSNFEKEFGSINKDKEQNITKVDVNNDLNSKTIEIQKPNLENNEKSLLSKNNNQTNTEDQNKNLTVVEHKHVVEMRVTSTGPIVDVLARAMLKDPTIVSQFIERDVREFV